MREKDRIDMKNFNFWIHVDTIAEVLALQKTLWPYQRTSMSGVMRQCLEMGIVQLRGNVAKMEKVIGGQA